MQAIIMAGGKGTRLSTVIKDKPKCFMEFEGYKLLDYQLKMYQKYGIREVVIVTGYQHHVISEYLKNTSNIRLVFNPFYEISNVLTSFWFGMRYLTDDFIYSHADTIFDIPIMESILNSPGEVILPVDVKACGEEEMKIQLDSSGKVALINKTMNPNNALGEFIGVCKISKKILPLLMDITNKQIENKNFSAFFEVALQELIENDRELVELVDISNFYWNEIDFPEDYRLAKSNFRSSNLLKLFS